MSCNDLRYNDFKKICVDKNYSLLGVAPDHVLQRAWINIYSEYAIISDDENVKMLIENIAQLTYLESRVMRVKLFCKQLLERRSDFVIKKLNELGYRYKFSKDSYIDDIDKTLNKLRNLEVQAEQLNTFIDEHTGKIDGRPLSYAMFDEKISEIERVFKVPVNTEILSAQMYGIKNKELRDHYRKLDDQNED